ncbi:MAG: rhamnogalacturonan lyase, partial [Prevotella sp.]|nr:rhamnogalacturonan lyase [Prevotella sp.]
MKLLLIALVVLFAFTNSISAQRVTDKLDRGLVAIPSGSGSFVSWRIFGEEYYDTEYNLYRDGTLVNSTPLKVSNYVDPNGKAGSTYQVEAVVKGKGQGKSASKARQNTQYIQFAVKSLQSRRGTDITNDYNINDIALA